MKLHKAIGILKTIRTFLVARVIAQEGEGCDKAPHGSIYYQIRGPITIQADGSEKAIVLIQGARTTTDPARDWLIMDHALELVQAVKLRSVNITPQTLYKHLVGKEYEPALKASYLDGGESDFTESSGFGDSDIGSTNIKVVPDDFVTHRNSWRGALLIAKIQSSNDSRSYWDHELQAFDAAYAKLGIDSHGKKSS